MYTSKSRGKSEHSQDESMMFDPKNLDIDFGSQVKIKAKEPIKRQSTYTKIKETYKAYHESVTSNSSDPTTEGNDNEFII